MSNPVANILLEIGALKISPQSPFTYGSGLRGPIYCDNRMISAHPSHRRQIVLAFKDLMTDWRPDGILALATGGIPHGAWLAEEVGLPFGYVRVEAKKYGKKKQVEGFDTKGASVVVIEDLINLGAALAQTLPGLSQRFSILGAMSIVNYNTPQSKELLSSLEFEIRSLMGLEDLMEASLQKGLITSEDKKIIRRWQQSPYHWEDME